MSLLQPGYVPDDEVIPGYRLIRFLGRGQFGEVWQAKGPDGLDVALKIIGLAGHEGLRELLALQRIKSIRHPNLNPLFAFWVKTEDGRIIENPGCLPSSAPFSGESTLSLPEDYRGSLELTIAMGLGSQSLYERLQDCLGAGLKGIPLDELLPYMEQTALALDYLNRPIHDLGDGKRSIIHGDIKPHNLLLVGGVVQVCDFGLARAMDTLRNTVSGIGTCACAYAAPELLDGCPHLHSDQYCLAITYIELRTGSLPFSAVNMLRVVELHRTGKLDFSALPPAEIEVIRRAASPRPDDRWPSCSEMVGALRAACEGRSPVSSAKPSSEVEWLRQPSPSLSTITVGPLLPPDSSPGTDEEQRVPDQALASATGSAIVQSTPNIPTDGHWQQRPTSSFTTLRAIVVLGVLGAIGAVVAVGGKFGRTLFPRDLSAHPQTAAEKVDVVPPKREHPHETVPSPGKRSATSSVESSSTESMKDRRDERGGDTSRREWILRLNKFMKNREFRQTEQMLDGIPIGLVDADEKEFLRQRARESWQSRFDAMLSANSVNEAVGMSCELGTCLFSGDEKSRFRTLAAQRWEQEWYRCLKSQRLAEAGEMLDRVPAILLDESRRSTLRNGLLLMLVDTIQQSDGRSHDARWEEDCRQWHTVLTKYLAHTPEARIERARERLDRGDYDGALTEVNGLVAAEVPEHLQVLRVGLSLIASSRSSHGSTVAQRQSYLLALDAVQRRINPPEYWDLSRQERSAIDRIRRELDSPTIPRTPY